MIQFIPSEIRKWYAVIFGIHAGSPNWKDSEYLARFIFIWMKTKYLIHIIVFVVVTNDGNIMPPFLHMVSDSLRWSTSSAWKRYSWPGSSEWMLENPKPGNRNQRHVTQPRPNVWCQKTSAIKSPLTSDRLTP